MGTLLNLVPFYYRWIALGLLLAAIYGTGFYRGGIGPRADRDALQARFNAFAASVKQVGDQAKAAREKDIIERKAISDRQEKQYGQSIAEIGAGYESYIASLRQSNSDSGSGKAKPLSSAAASLDCPNRSADIAQGLERLESGVLGLLKRGDLAIQRTIACKGWIDEQVAKP